MVSLKELKEMQLADLEQVDSMIDERLVVLEKKGAILDKRIADNEDSVVLGIEPNYDPELISQMKDELEKEIKELKQILDHLPTLINAEKSRLRRKADESLKAELILAFADIGRILSKEKRNKRDEERLSEIKRLFKTSRHKHVMQRILYEIGLRPPSKEAMQIREHNPVKEIIIPKVKE